MPLPRPRGNGHELVRGIAAAAAGGIAASLILLVPARAGADDLLQPGVDLVSFKPAPGESFGTIERPRILGEGRYRLDLAMDGRAGPSGSAGW